MKSCGLLFAMHRSGSVRESSPLVTKGRSSRGGDDEELSQVECSAVTRFLKAIPGTGTLRLQSFN